MAKKTHFRTSNAEERPIRTLCGGPVRSPRKATIHWGQVTCTKCQRRGEAQDRRFERSADWTPGS
jgi:hypothetical protein